MNAPLGLLGVGGVEDALSSSNVCDSIDDLQHQLHSLTVSKSTETRAEHISVLFEFRYDTVFYITEEPEVGATDGEDFAHSHQEQHQEQQPATRTVNTSETLQNQSADDPALQRAVAKHIAVATGVADGSSWSTQQESRDAQGWTFTYLCDNSLQMWNRHNAKRPNRPVIGAFSGYGGLDPVNISRPAFDCRGALRISFSKSSRAVIVNYEHTPLHKTVSDLVDRLQPTLPQLPVANSNAANANKSVKAKRPPPATGTEGGQKKRDKKSKAADGTEEAATLEGNNSQPQAATAESLPASVFATSIPTISPLEAARRRELALKLLAGKNIDPVTLSPEQFNIFANQAPNLQESSLDMLVKYGAERLRIVHPDEKDQPSSSAIIPVQKNNLESAATSNSTAGTPTIIETPSMDKLPNEQLHPVITESPVRDVPESAATNRASMPTTSLTQKPSRPRKPRGACSTCKQNQRKCTKEHPTCSNCIQAEETCVYLPPKPRKKPDKSTVAVSAEEAINISISVHQQYETDNAQPIQVTRPEEPIQPYSQTAQIVRPYTNNDDSIHNPSISSEIVEQPTGNQWSTAGDIQAQGHELAPPHLNNSQPTPQTFPQTQVHRDILQSLPALSYSSTEQSAQLAHQSSGWELPVPALAAQTSQNARTTTSRNSNKRGISTLKGPQSERVGLNSSVEGEHVTTWHNTPNSVGLPSQANTKSPGILHQQQPHQRPQSRTSGVDPDSQVSEILEANVAMSEKAMQYKDKSAQATKLTHPSPVQKPSANFREGHISDNYTSMTQRHASALHIPASHSEPIFDSSHKNSTRASTLSSELAYDPYGRLNATGTDQYPRTDNHLSPEISHEFGSNNGQLSVAHSYEYSQGTGTGHGLSQALEDTSFGSTDIGNANQWQRSQNHISRSNAAAPSRTMSPYKLPNQNTFSSYPQGISSGQNQQNYKPDRLQQSFSHGSYSPHQPSTNHQQDQPWLSFNRASTNTKTNSTSYSSGPRNTGRNNTPTLNNTGYNQDQQPNIPG